ncbi:MAG TPA: hypothetical protein VLK82_18890 [Candidatus Tectomicrobia bacterium]|nr:hypothetical protein [Candidatus Tectomicrobia bacterium]
MTSAEVAAVREAGNARPTATGKPRTRPYLAIRLDAEEEAQLRALGCAAQGAMFVLRYAARMRGNSRERVVVGSRHLDNCYVPRREFYRGIAKLEAAEFITVVQCGRRIESYALLDRASKGKQAS